MSFRKLRFMSILIAFVMLIGININSYAEIIDLDATDIKDDNSELSDDNSEKTDTIEPVDSELDIFEKMILLEDEVDNESVLETNPDMIDAPEVVSSPYIFYPQSEKSKELDIPMMMNFSHRMISLDESGDHNNIDYPLPGSVSLDKWATKVEDSDNLWRIDLTLTGKNIHSTSDIVLVIDRSGSMSGARMGAAKNAAANFINTLLANEDNTSIRIAVVSFSSNVTVHNQPSPFKTFDGKTDLLLAVNGLNASGGTFTQAALKQAEALLSSSTADYRNIVLLSDGEPTYSYALDNFNSKRNPTYFENCGGNNWQNKDNLMETDYNYGSTAGNGNSMTTQVNTLSGQTYYYNHGNSAVAESRFIKNNSTTIYSVGLSAGSDGQSVLNRIASPGKSYTASTSDLNEIFQTIAGSIAYAATNAVVTDPMGGMFGIETINETNYLDRIHVNRGSVSWDNLTQTITWNIGEVSEDNPATMWYIVEIAETAESGEVYPTNKHTFLTYTNANGVQAQKSFPIPEAGIELIEVTVVFDENYIGAPSLYERTTNKGNSLGIDMPNNPSRNMYSFLGWNTQPDGGGLPFTSSTTIENNLIVYAQWLPNLGEKLVIGSYLDIYDSEAHSISVDNLVDNDIVYYSLTNNGEDWMTEKPYFTNVSSSTIYVKVVNPNFLDRIGSGTVVINPRPLTITSGSDSKLYDGTPLINMTYNITGGSLAPYEVIDSINIAGTITNVGSAPNLISDVIIKDGEIVTTYNYTINYVPGTLIITPAIGDELVVSGYTGIYDALEHGVTVTGQMSGDLIEYCLDGEEWSTTNPLFKDVSITTIYVRATNPSYTDRSGSAVVNITPRPITVTAASDNKVYDGIPLTNSSFSLTSGSLVEGHNLDVNVTGSQINVGSSPNIPSDAVLLEGEVDVTSNYAIIYVNGQLSVSPATGPSLTIESYNGVYDGEYHGIELDGIIDGDEMFFYLLGETESIEEINWNEIDWSTINPSFVNVGNRTILVKVVNQMYNDRTGIGTVAIAPRPITITAGSASKVFDGQPLINDNYSMTSGSLVDGEDIFDVIITGSISQVGSAPNTPSNAVIGIIEGPTTTSNYEITYVNGTLTITQPFTPPLVYQISFIADNGGSLEGPTSSNVMAGTIWGLITVPTPIADEGFEFIGWTPDFPGNIYQNWTFTANFQEIELEIEEEPIPEVPPVVEEEEEEEEVVEIVEEEIPESTPTLPKTGHTEPLLIYGFGALFLGLFTKRRIK